MLVTSSGSPLLLAGQQVLHSGTFVDNFQRVTSLPHAPLGMGWTDLGSLFPQSYDPARIYNGGVTSGDPYARGNNGATMAPDDDWEHYADYPGMAGGGIGGAVRNLGTGQFNYDVTVRMSGVLSGGTEHGAEAEGTPLVGVDTATPGVGYGAWLVNMRNVIAPYNTDVFVFLIGTINNPPESFTVYYRSGLVTHTDGQARDLTIKYRGSTITIWLDDVQVTGLIDHQTDLPASSTITLPAAHQNKSWAGFAFDHHITPPADITTTPAVLRYSHQIIT